MARTLDEKRSFFNQNRGTIFATDFCGLAPPKNPGENVAMKIGYARVSKGEQRTAAQVRALEADGCAMIYEDRAGGVARRPELERALEALREGDTFTVWKFDRLARSLPDLLQIVETIDGKKANLRSLTEEIDTSSLTGRAMFQIMGALAQFERGLIRERTKAGLAAAREAGRVGGRPRALTPSQVAHAIELIDGGEGIGAVARSFKVARSTLRTAINKHHAKTEA